MGLQQSKDELLYEQVGYGNVEGIKSLHSQGASLEWVDKECKTSLMVACMNPGLSNVAKTLIELGANVNAYRPGRHAGIPLHHAAKRGLEDTVNLLIAHGELCLEAKNKLLNLNLVQSVPYHAPPALMLSGFAILATHIMSAPVHQMQQYYRLGTLDNCSGKWSALVDCLTLKTKRSPEVQEILDAREKAKFHIWMFRTPEEASIYWQEQFGHLDEME